jgi:PAS domain S-box-containing protein
MTTNIPLPSNFEAEMIRAVKYEFELIRAVVEQAPDAIIVTNDAGDIRIWNNRAVEIFGFSVREALEGGLNLIIPEYLRPAHWRGFHEAVTAGKTKSKGRPVLSRAVHKSGKKLYVELSFAILVDKGGKALGALAIARDVTETRLTGAAQQKQ